MFHEAAEIRTQWRSWRWWRSWHLCARAPAHSAIRAARNRYRSQAVLRGAV